MKTRILLLLLSWLLGVVGVSAQNVLFWGSKQGLSNSRIKNIYEDSRHNVWITTQNGLNRYDGVKMNVYRHEIGNPNSLLYDESTCVFEWEPNCVLVGTGAGVQRFDYATGKFYDVPYVGTNGDTITTRTVNICSVDGKVVICYTGYGHGVLAKNKDGEWIVKNSLEFLTGPEQFSPTQLLEDEKKNVWVVNSVRQLYRRVGKTFLRYDELSDVRRLCVSTTGRVYAATDNNGIYRYELRADRFVQVVSPKDLNAVVTNISAWSDGRIFICTDGGGLWFYDEGASRLVKSTISVKDFNFDTSNVNDAILDSFGNVWVGVYMKGVMMKPVNQSAFEYIGQNSISKNTIGSNSVFTIAKAAVQDGEESAFWVATDNDGLYRVSGDGKVSTHWTQRTSPGMPKSFTSIQNPTPGTLLLGTFNEGLWRMQDGRFSLLSKSINQVFDIQPAKEPNCYWIATIGQGFHYYNFATGKTISYRADYSKAGGTDVIGNLYVYTILPVGDKLFVGTADGLAVAYPGANGIIKKASTKMLSGTVVRHFAVSADGSTVWAATNRGLVKIDYRTLKTHTYTTEDGLPVNSLVSLCVDGNNLWIGTDMGLSCMDVKAETFTSFFSDDGLQDNEFNRGSVVKMNGKLYFGGIGGITYFDMGEMKAWQNDQTSLHLRLVDVLVGGKAVHQGDLSGNIEMLDGLIDECGRLDLSYRENRFTLEVCVEGLNKMHVVYEYSVNGGEWHNQGNDNNRLVFDNLDAGTYRIKVRARALGGMSEVRELIVVVHPAWYASTWAKTLYLFLFLFVCWLIYGYVRRRVHMRRVMRRHRQQQELNEARVQFFMNISHEIRTPMTLILAPLERLIGTDNDKERQRNYQLIKQNAKRILRLINQMMDVRKIEQGKFLLDYGQVELVSFLQSIFDVFVTNASSRGISYEFQHDVDHLPVYVDGDNLDKIVMNLLSNAFKFTPDGGKIVLRLTVLNDHFELRFIDSGVGIKDEDKPKVFERFYSAGHQNGYIGTGIGLHLTSMLVKLHKGEITVGDNPVGEGTEFVVTIPVGDESLKTMKPASFADEVEGMDAIDEDTAGLLSVNKPTDAHRRNAVLVEDDDAIRQYVHSELSADFVFQLCNNGQEAWDYIIAHPDKVDLVISDIMMPVMDGLTLCQKMKANFNTNHIPVVLMTALGSDADRIAGLTNGADAYVSKPFNIDVLRTTAIQLLKSRHLLQGRFNGDKQCEDKLEKVEMESPDEHLMKRVMKVINENLDNSELSVEIIADMVGISRVHFYRKMKDLTGQAPRDFVKYVRLKAAAQMLAEKKLDITGVSIATGFKSLSAFSTNFKALYGLSPSEWVKKNVES